MTTNTRSEAIAGKNLTVTQTFWGAEITEENFGKGAKVLRAVQVYYWLASRFANCHSSYACFGLRLAGKNLDDYYMFSSDGATYHNGSHLRPVVSLKSSVQIEASSTASSSTGTAHHITQY